jgi:hypothetical protein
MNPRKRQKRMIATKGATTRKAKKEFCISDTTCIKEALPRERRVILCEYYSHSLSNLSKRKHRGGVLSRLSLVYLSTDDRCGGDVVFSAHD